MSKIKTIIPNEKFEYVRDRIAEILISEFDYQFYLTSDPDLKVGVFVERNTFDKTEATFINVSVAKGDYGSKHQGQTQGDYTFFIDVHTNAKSKGIKSGDTISAVKSQRIAGKIRSILEDPLYKTLGIVPPYISRVFFDKFEVATPIQNDGLNTTMIRQYLHVHMPETNKLTVPHLIEGYDTVVKVNNTNEGYQYIGDTYL